MGARGAEEERSIDIVGAGRLGAFLAAALRNCGFAIGEIIARDLPSSLRQARSVAAKVGARAVTANAASLNSSILWFCVPDREILRAAAALKGRLRFNAAANRFHTCFAFHSSGALLSDELEPLRKIGIKVASVHPLMTFVRGARPSLSDVPFAIEGDSEARRVANQIVRKLGGESLALASSSKANYHAWATMSSPLLLAFLVTLEEAAKSAGLTRAQARRMSLPIVRQTVLNYSKLGSARSFSGPFVRGDAQVVAKHMAALEKGSSAQEVYVALARAALRGLPVKNRGELKRLLRF
jgi:predicted short-subunit dehydrogenase-like oxidoreductase (DUF2520 family)